MTETTEAVAEATATPAAKSIVDPKYRGKYKGPKDWLASYLETHATRIKEVKVTKADPANPDAKINVTEKRPDGVDTDALIKLARINGRNVDALEAQSGSHGFAGRARMTIRNMLQLVVKERHGLVGLDGTFVQAPADFVAGIKGVSANPTHTPEGVKIAVAKPTPATAPATESEATTASEAPAETESTPSPSSPTKGGKKAA